MRSLQLTIPLLKTKTTITALRSGETKLCIAKSKIKNSIISVVLIDKKLNHMKYSAVNITDQKVILNVKGYDAFWIERPRPSLKYTIDVSIE